MDNAVRASLLEFRDSLEAAGRNDPALGDTAGNLKQPIRGGDFLWRFDVNPALNAGWDPKHGLGFDLLCGVAVSSEARVPQNLLFRKELTDLNLTLIVASSKMEQTGALTQAANAAVKRLEGYAKSKRSALLSANISYGDPNRGTWAEWAKQYSDSADFGGKPMKEFFSA